MALRVTRIIGFMIICLFFISSISIAQNSTKKQDIAAIKAMEGCYEVEFKYTETFAPEVDYEKAYDYTSSAYEWAEVIEETDDKIVIQHLLIINDSTIIKHWRQDWIFEADKEFTYDVDNRWVFNEIPPSQRNGTWTQNVYQVDDSPRYSGTATWTHVDGVSSWHDIADSPLPRREYSKRDDYNVLRRGNRVIITDYGWLHEQDNDKIIREGGEDRLLVQEKGYNTYTKKVNSGCKPAQDWWAENKAMWADVRDAWYDFYVDAEEIDLKVKVDDKMLFEHLFYGKKEWTHAEINDLLHKYIN